MKPEQDTPELDAYAILVAADVFARQHEICCYPTATDAEAELATKAIIRAYLAAAHPPGVWARLNEQLLPDGDFVPPKTPRATLGWLGRKMRVK